MMNRLSIMEDAISTCESTIANERTNRKAISQDVKAKNIELKALISKEKDTVNNKINVHVEGNLESAVRERMKLK